MKPQTRGRQQRSLDCAIHSQIFLETEKHIHKLATAYAEQAVGNSFRERKERKRTRDARKIQLREIFFASFAQIVFYLQGAIFWPRNFFLTPNLLNRFAQEALK